MFDDNVGHGTICEKIAILGKQTKAVTFNFHVHVHYS